MKTPTQATPLEFSGPRKSPEFIPLVAVAKDQAFDLAVSQV